MRRPPSPRLHRLGWLPKWAGRVAPEAVGRHSPLLDPHGAHYSITIPRHPSARLRIYQIYSTGGICMYCIDRRIDHMHDPDSPHGHTPITTRHWLSAGATASGTISRTLGAPVAHGVSQRATPELPCEPPPPYIIRNIYIYPAPGTRAQHDLSHGTPAHSMVYGVSRAPSRTTRPN